MDSHLDAPLWGIFGGSFDPPHVGHVALVRNLITLCPLAGVVVVPSFRHPLKKHQFACSFEHRLAMSQLVFGESAGVYVSDVEERHDLSGYTIDTILSLKQEYPERKWAYIIGADLLRQFPTWHRPNDILEEVVLIVAERPGYPVDLPKSVSASQVRVVETPLVNAASHTIRKVIHESGCSSAKELLPSAVLQYIEKHQLYL